jgi:hypothetical protein
MGLSFTIAAGPRQSSHFRVLVSWDTWPYFTVSDSRLPFPSPPTTRRVTVEVFDLASTRQTSALFLPSANRVEITLKVSVCGPWSCFIPVCYNPSIYASLVIMMIESDFAIAEHRTPSVVESPFLFTTLPSGSKLKHVWMQMVDGAFGVFLCFEIH